MFLQYLGEDLQLRYWQGQLCFEEETYPCTAYLVDIHAALGE